MFFLSVILINHVQNIVKYLNIISFLTGTLGVICHVNSFWDDYIFSNDDDHI